MTLDRLSDGYEPRFDIDYAFGKQAEFWVADIIRAIGTERVEVKHDARCADTGNVYVETECRRGGRWCKSGISTTTAELWAFVLDAGSCCFFVSTERLKLVCRTLWKDPTKRVECPRGSHPTKGLRVPVSRLLKMRAEVP